MLDDKNMPDAAANFIDDLDAQIAEIDAPDDDLSEFGRASERDDYYSAPTVAETETIAISDPDLGGCGEKSDAAMLKDLRSQLMARLGPEDKFLGWQSTLYNLRKILALDPKIAGALAYNEMACEPVFTRDVRLADDLSPITLEDDEPLPVSDNHVKDIRSWLSGPENDRGWAISMRSEDVSQSISSVARNKSFHPIKEQYEAEEWDGVARLDDFFIRHYRTEDNVYYREASRIFLLAMCARIYVPGFDFQYMLVIQGETGARKSTSLKKIAGDQHHTEVEAGTMKDPKTKTEALVGSHLVEFPELTALLAMPFDEAKILISQGKAKVRLAFEARASIRKLSSVLVGTTEKQAYLRDPLGNRRYLPIVISPRFNEFHPIDEKAIEAEMPQVRAEALVRFKEIWAAGVRHLQLSDEAKVIQRRLTSVASMETEADSIKGRLEEILMTPVTVDPRSIPDRHEHLYLQGPDGQLYRRFWFREQLLDRLHAKGYDINYLRGSKAKGNDMSVALEGLKWLVATGGQMIMPDERSYGRQRVLEIQPEEFFASMAERETQDGRGQEKPVDVDHPAELQFG